MPAPLPPLPLSVTLEARDPAGLGRFWAAALHGRLQREEPPDGAVTVTGPGTSLRLAPTSSGPGAAWPVSAGPVHLDLVPVRPQAEEVARLLALGATVREDRTASGRVLLADPEGNAFGVGRSAVERGAREPVDTGERRMPAVHAAEERTLLTGMLDWYREGVLQKVDGVRPTDLGSSPLRSGTSIAGLLKHLAYVEDAWTTERLAGRPAPEPWASAPFDDDPDWEFSSAPDDRLEDLVELYRAACARSRDAVADLPLDHTVEHRGRQCSTRFVLLHVLEETARHLGHLDLLRELADGSTGE